MEKRACLKELDDILCLAKKVKYLWDKDPKLEVQFYYVLPEQDEEARISVGRYEKKLGFSIGGSYFSNFRDKLGQKIRREGLSSREAFEIASGLLENKALEDGHLMDNFKRALRLPLGYYLADKELKEI